MSTLKVKLRTDQPDKNGLCKLFLIYRNGNEPIYKHSIGEKVLPTQFDKKSEKVISHNRKTEINYIIAQHKKMITDVLFDLQRKNTTPSTARVKAIVKKIEQKQKIESFVKIQPSDIDNRFATFNKTTPPPLTAWNEFISLRKNLLNKTTIGIYQTTLKHLETFCINYDKLFNWELFDGDFYNHWNNYFIDDCENRYGDIGLSNNTIGKYFKTLKSFLNWALDKEYHSSIKFKKYKVLHETIDIHPLSEAHLAKIVAFCEDDTNEFRLRKVASLFIFLSTTGMRYSDGQNLRWADLYYSGEGDVEQQVIKYTSQKTGQKILIPFSTYSLRELMRNALEFDKGKTKISEILQPQVSIFDFDVLRSHFKYEEDFDKPLMPQISSAKFNKYIKEVGEKCKFIEPVSITRKSGSESETKIYKRWEKISSHDCRRTFITLSLAKGMRPETVMTFTGHTSYKTMLRYNRISEKVKINEFHEVWGKSIKTFDDIFGHAELTVGGIKKTIKKS